MAAQFMEQDASLVPIWHEDLEDSWRATSRQSTLKGQRRWVLILVLRSAEEEETTAAIE